MAAKLATNRTVVVGAGKSVDSAYRILNNIMANLGIIKKLHRNRYYEKPTKKKERMEYEKCLRVYNREMKNKVIFVMKMHKPLPPI